MSKPNPADRFYSRDHEWVKDHGDGAVMVGVTDYAQEMLTDIVFVELPATGKTVAKGAPMAVVESVKSVSDVLAPVSGVILDVNLSLEETPELINQDAFGDGWIVKIRLSDDRDLQSLMNSADYEAWLQEEKH